jgi:hypothetical protein
MSGGVTSFLFFVVVVVAFLYDTVLGIRMLGLWGIACGIYWIRTGKIPYGWRGMAPSGYLTGWAAVAGGGVAITLGMVFLVAPKLVEPLYSVHR